MSARTPMTITTAAPPAEWTPEAPLRNLQAVELTPDRQQRLDAAAAGADGDPVWRARKISEARELLALEQVTPPGRVEIRRLDLREHLRVAVGLSVPVAVMPDPGGEIRVLDRAIVGFTYPRLLLSCSLPGTVIACLLAPAHGAWYPNIVFGCPQQMCFGTHVPAAIPVRELVLAAYGLLSLQTVTLDPRDRAGVLNVPAALWWQERLDRMPLTRRTLLEPDTDAGTATGADLGAP